VQINLWVDTIIATLLPHGAVSLIYYADRVNQLPLAIIGTAMGTALLPLLSRQMRENNHVAARATQNRALEVALLLTLPCAIMLIMEATPVISLLFERGAFSAKETMGSSATLVAFALGLPAFVMVKNFAPGFFAVHDTKTPVKYAVCCMILNIVFNLIFMRYLQQVGIALATSLSAWINVTLLATTLARRGLFVPDAQLKKRLPRIMAACAGMAVALWCGNHFFYTVHTGNLLSRITAFCVLASSAGVVYLVICHYLNAFRLSDVKAMFVRKR
jgi:putative peptidoglycan lipid II flippase